MISRCTSSGWYHHVRCILYTDKVSNGMWNTRVCQCCLFSYVYQQALKGVGCEPVSLTIAVAFFGEAVSIGTLVDKLILSIQMWLMYVSSYATDRPGHSVGHPAGALAYFVIGFLYMVGLHLVWRSVKMTMSFLESSWLFQGVIPYTHTNCVWYQLM